jgi:hypothetical protein
MNVTSREELRGFVNNLQFLEELMCGFEMSLDNNFR